MYFYIDDTLHKKPPPCLSIVAVYNSRIWDEDLSTKINLSHLVALVVVCSMAVVLLFLVHCLLLLLLFLLRNTLCTV